jgi:hypothetical protein
MTTDSSRLAWGVQANIRKAASISLQAIETKGGTSWNGLRGW